MSEVRLPGRICGEWIWREDLLDVPDVTVMFRREFVCSCIGEETDLWISAKDTYQLFINGRFIGFGPRAHQNLDTSYIDQHEITFYLEPGINVVAVLVTRSTLAAPCGDRREPGLWCQIATHRENIVSTDRSWLLCEAECYSGHRARISNDQGLAQLFQAELCPANWAMPMTEPASCWGAPDYITPVGEAGAMLELYPLAPPSIGDEHLEFSFDCGGKLKKIPNWTSVIFPDMKPGPSTGASAAFTYLFSEEDSTLAVRLFSDDPFKLFCNNHLVAAKSHMAGEQTLDLPLRAGWNRLLLFQSPNYNSMGFLILFGKDGGNNDVRIWQDMVETAPAAWSIADSLHLPLESATPPIHFEKLQTQSRHVALSEMADPGTLLAHCEHCEDPAIPVGKGLGEHEFAIYTLLAMSYGFVRLLVEANAGDVVDISIGTHRDDSGRIFSSNDLRSTSTMICGQGHNHFLSSLPGDCYCVMVSIRKTAGAVKVLSLSFDELVRPERHEAFFRCSDDLFNRFWETGRLTLRRSAAFVPVVGARTHSDCCILDAYVNAVNMAAVYGDFDYAAARLRQFIDAQYENGEIPVLTYGGVYRSQFEQLFFFPVWINYNYRFSANLVELERSIAALDLLREYFTTLLDENGLLVNLNERFSLPATLTVGPRFASGEVPTVWNALFCRFLLSSAEIYRVVNQPVNAKQCIAQAQRIAGVLQLNNFDSEQKLFASCQLDSPQADFDLWSNFSAMLGGVSPLDTFEDFFYAFFNFDPPFDRDTEARRPFFNFLFLEMMFALGQHEWGLRYFRSYWESRLSGTPGAWGAEFDSRVPVATQFANGSRISPNIFLLREVLGIRIAEAGHSVIYFNPAFRFLESAEGVIPMARGRLKVKWARLADGTLDVTLDANIKLKIVPELSHEQLHNTTFHLGESVTLLDPPDELVEGY